MWAPLRTSFPRPLDALLPFPLAKTSCRTLGTASAPAATTTAATAASAIPRRPHANTAATITPTASAAKLDCEYEK